MEFFEHVRLFCPKEIRSIWRGYIFEEFPAVTLMKYKGVNP